MKLFICKYINSNERPQFYFLWCVVVCGVRCVECGVWSVECGVWSGEWRVWIAEYRVWSVCVWIVECETQCETH